MPKKDILHRHWIYLCTDKRKLPPVLGSYKISQFQQPPTRRDADLVDYRPRDVFTSRVSSSALPLVGVPDIDWMRRKGHCLPTESEVLQSQRSLHMDRSFVGRPIRAPRLSDISSTSSIPMAPVKTRYSSFVSHHENDRKIATQRQMEQRIMRSRAFHYQKRLNQAISRDEGMTRKFASEALDDDHKEILDKLVQDSEGSLEGSSKSSMFHEWKRSVMSVIDLQGEDDLKMVANFRSIVRRSKQPVLRKRRMTEMLSQTDITSKAKSQTDSMFLYEVDSASTVSDYPEEEKQVQFLGQEKTPLKRQPSPFSSNHSSVTDMSFDFN